MACPGQSPSGFQENHLSPSNITLFLIRNVFLAKLVEWSHGQSVFCHANEGASPTELGLLKTVDAGRQACRRTSVPGILSCCMMTRSLQTEMLWKRLVFAWPWHLVHVLHPCAGKAMRLPDGGQLGLEIDAPLAPVTEMKSASNVQLAFASFILTSLE